jgi:small subunit ribosomal protein S7
MAQMQNVANGGHVFDPETEGHKFGLPNLPIPSDSNLKYRYDPVVSQVTNLLMRHGKKSVAQRVGSSVLFFYFLRRPVTTH